MKKMTPEQADTLIKARLAQFSTKGGKQSNKLSKWTDEELELRDSIIIDLITTQAYSKYKAAQEVAGRWDIHLSTARQYVQDAVNRWAKDYAEEDEGQNKRKFLETLENLLQDSIVKGQKESALKALDMVSKIKGYYVNKQDVNLQTDGKLTFNFGTTGDTDNRD